MNTIIFNKYLFIKNNELKLKLYNFPFKFISPKILYKCDIKFNPGVFKLTTEYKKSSFFKHYIQIADFITSFTGVVSRAPILYFHKFAKSTLKFRKRDNIYFTLLLQLKLYQQIKFFLKLPIFLNFLSSMSKQLYHAYKIKSGLIGIRMIKNKITLYILNPHYSHSYLHNLKITNTKIILKVCFDSLNQKLLRQLLSFLH